MGGDDHVARWAERQRGKALHIGTYEAAIHNMLRRIDDQADHGTQFYLYRVRLAPKITVRQEWLIDPSSFVGDVVLDEVCPLGIDVARYLNYHEDPGALSLALCRTVIASTQQIAIPLLSNEDSSWVATAVGELASANLTSPPPSRSRPIGRRRAPSPRTSKAREFTASLAERLPANLRSQFESAAALPDNLAPEDWARYVLGLVSLVLRPGQILRELDGQPRRRI
jgi:hypothetical protein